MDLIQTLSKLVSIPSVNPMGGPGRGPEYGESRLTDYLQSLLKELGIEVARFPVEAGRDNLIARLDGHVPPARGGRVLLFAAHQDTVPVEGMTIEPFAAKVSGGRLYGRGACDVKGGMAAMLTALARLARQRPAGMPTVVLGLTVNEECGFTGAKALVKLWTERPGGILPCKPHAAIVAEPTGLQVVVAHKGVVRWRTHTTGRAAHSSRPEAGQNAIYRMARIVQALERYHLEVLGKRPPHALCGPATLSVGTIRGGASVNTVPDRCTIEIDRRLMPQECTQEAYQEAVDFLAKETPMVPPPIHDPPFMLGSPLSDVENRGLADRLASAARPVICECRQIGVPYATDAAFFAAGGVPSVVFGPGSIEQAHTADEWIALDQLEQAAEIYYRAALVDWP